MAIILLFLVIPLDTGNAFSLQNDQVVEHKRKEQLAKYDRYFKKFEHSKALDAAMDVSSHHITSNMVDVELIISNI